jgi:hypothetical protein
MQAVVQKDRSRPVGAAPAAGYSAASASAVEKGGIGEEALVIRAEMM